jgi:hypothetical protein
MIGPALAGRLLQVIGWVMREASAKLESFACRTSSSALM